MLTNSRDITKMPKGELDQSHHAAKVLSMSTPRLIVVAGVAAVIVIAPFIWLAVKSGATFKATASAEISIGGKKD